MLVYTAINIPYCALGAVLTADPKERVSVQSYRFVFAMLGGLMVTALTLPLVEFFGQGDRAKGYQLTIMAMSALGVLMFLACFYGTKERINPPKEAVSRSYMDNFRQLWKNDQWRVLALVALCLMSGYVLRTTLAIYYVKYYSGNAGQHHVVYYFRYARQYGRLCHSSAFGKTLLQSKTLYRHSDFGSRPLCQQLFCSG